MRCVAKGQYNGQAISLVSEEVKNIKKGKRKGAIALHQAKISAMDDLAIIAEFLARNERGIIPDHHKQLMTTINAIGIKEGKLTEGARKILIDVIVSSEENI